LIEYILLAVSSLFVIVDPLAAVPSFLTMTPNDTPEQRIRSARLASCVAAAVLLVFAIAGNLVFKIFSMGAHWFRPCEHARGGMPRTMRWPR
jgi:multiple antibiotic resistance protein